MSIYLRELNANKARVKAIDRAIAEFKQLANDIKNFRPEQRMTTSYDGMSVFSNTGTHSDPTAWFASYSVPYEDLEVIYAEIRKLMIERQKVTGWINLAEAALEFLPEKQRIIVVMRAIEGRTWEDIAFEYCDRTGQTISDKTCCKRYHQALRAIDPFFRKNEDPPISINEIVPKLKSVR